MSRPHATLVVACVAATIAFACYARTLLPGVDLGDTAAFQAAVLYPEVSARQAYPLYYGLAKPFVGSLSPGNPALGLNLFSAVWGAVAVGTAAAITVQLTHSVAGGFAAGLLLAFSYTFWTQAVIAEVYTLHLALIGLCLLALRGVESRPGMGRLALFFALYAVSFGNHLSMILLLPPFAAFLLMSARTRTMLSPAAFGAAAACAAIGALQYLPSLMAIVNAPDAPALWSERLAAFWFDVTKADWRESMVMGVGGQQLQDRLGMFGFDAQQQFGLGGIALALLGMVRLVTAAPRWALLLVLAWSINALFALTYNVGDAHVFFLPSHYMAAIAAGCAFIRPTPGSVDRWPRHARQALAAVALVFVVWRGWDTWPAADRHADRRAERLVTRLTLGLSAQTALLVSSLNWQVDNALLYAERYMRPDLAWVRLSDVLLHFPLLVRDNHAAGRDIVLTARAADDVRAAFGDAFPIVADVGPPVERLSVAAARVPRGALYVLAVLAPPRDTPLDDNDLTTALRTLTGAESTASRTSYFVVGGRAGERPVLTHAADRPFRTQVRAASSRLDIRMDAWLPAETFRRGGFGHVLRDRRHALILERGANLVWWDADGRAVAGVYDAGLYGHEPRFRIPASAPGLAHHLVRRTH